jgi:glycosyltransferase involved in cell wall biosynthesis
MYVSVIIPVRNNASGLEICLNALRRQTFPHEDFEIIVVDNDSTDDIDRLEPLFPEVQWLRSEGTGSFAARNVALEIAQGEIFAFTDSDCIPEPVWLAEGVGALKAGLGTIIGGNVELLDPVGRDLNVWEWMEIIGSNLPDSRRNVEERGFTTTGNVVTYRKCFERCGPFDATLKSGGDVDWVQRAVRMGEKLVYVHECMVRHPRRSTYAALSLKYRRQAGGRIVRMLLRTKPSSLKIISELFRLSPLDPRVWGLALFYPKIKITQRLNFIGAVLVLSSITAVERFRVFFGGDPSRG